MSSKIENNNVLAHKKLIREKCAHDGVLVAPIDLMLGATQPVQLEPLRWLNFEDHPSRMKLTNTGDTLVVSGKWTNERPYLNGGPLEGNYVFSQIHFHWGSSEHEGSEHKVRGISYPMEMHVVFYKTVYLTQAAALRQDDGVIILAYLFKLQARSSPGLHWLAGQLGSVVEPHTSTQVSPTPLASVLMPFNTDYITYWGSLVTQHCRHPVLWLVSRTALAISSEDLNLFRCLLNARKETMIKNFRATSSAAGRTVFHVNPSTNMKNLLLPGAGELPCPVVTVNCTLTPPMNITEASGMFEKGDSKELKAKDSLVEIQKGLLKKHIQNLCCKGIVRKISREMTVDKGTSKVIKPSNISNRNTLMNLKESKFSKEKQRQKSRLPVPTVKTRQIKHGLESRYASYFRPDTAPMDMMKPQTPVPRPLTQN